MGNGGSASLASHFACDLGKGTLQNYDSKEKRFRVISLTDNSAVMTAYSNDLAYEHVFSQQLRNLLNEGDIVIGISASGNSKNVLQAVKQAKKRGMFTIGLLGCNGGTIKGIVALPLVIPSQNTPRIQESHITIGHIICNLVEKELFA